MEDAYYPFLSRREGLNESQKYNEFFKIHSPGENKFDGIENIDDIDCVRISLTLSGTQNMLTQSQGYEIKTSGSFTGTSVVFFALKEG